MYFCSVGRT